MEFLEVGDGLGLRLQRDVAQRVVSQRECRNGNMVWVWAARLLQWMLSGRNRIAEEDRSWGLGQEIQ